MTWMSFVTRASSVFLVLPLMVTRFSSADISLWYLFMTALNFQVLADIGFSSTLIRMFSYARGGLSINELKYVKRSGPEDTVKECNWDTVQTIWQVMNSIYIRLGLSLGVFIIFSSYLLYHPILRSANPTRSTVAWVIIIFTSFIQLRYSTFANYLQGMNQIALVKKWESFLNLLSIITNCLILYLGGDILILVISCQFWMIVNILRDYFLSKNIAGGRLKMISTRAKKNKIVFAAIWPSVWKSGVGTLMSVGVLQIINLIIANNGDTKAVASYLLGYNLIRQISTFSQAPFYSRIPALAQFRAQGEMSSFLKLVKRGMTMSYWSFILPAIAAGVFGTYGLRYIHSHINFPSFLLWGCLCFGILLERCGAMHIQIYSTSNKIIWHIVTGVSGSLVIISCLILKPHIGIYSVPVAMILGNLLFYTWYSMYHSYREFNFNFFKLESKGLIPCLIIMLTYLIFAFITR
jgi:O-antigen/teichoic acid export membrane protein